MLEHAKKLTESVNDAFHQEADEADTQNVSTQAAETGLDVAHHAKAAVHRLYATQADARRAVKQTEASDLPGASPILVEQRAVSPLVLHDSPPSKTEAPIHHEQTLIGKKEQALAQPCSRRAGAEKRQQSQSKAQQKKAIRRQYMQAANGQPLPPNMPVSRAAEKARRNRRFQRSKAGADCPEKTEYLCVYPLCRAALLCPQRAKRVRADSGIDHAGHRHDHLSCGRR